MMEISTATNIGTRDENQDVYGVYEEQTWIIADAHGPSGEECARNIVEEIIYNSLTPTPENILRLFEKLDRENKYQRCGSTVSAVWKTKKGFICAQLGDSPIFWRRDSQIAVSWGHGISNLENLDYLELERRGVEFFGPYQRAARDPNQMLNLSRAIGDLIFEGNVSKIPDIFEIEADAVLICSDGFTGSRAEVKKIFDKRAEADKVIENQRERGISDNITAITIYEP